MQLLRKTLVFTAWILILGLSIYFFGGNVVPYFNGYRSKLFGETLFSNQLWVILHLLGGSLALLLGPFQFSQALRENYLSAHRIMGKFYLLGIGLIGISGLRLSLISNCTPCRVSLFLLTILALFTSWMALQAVRRRNLKAHRQFMVRSYVLVLSFVAVRLDQLVPLNFLFGTIEDPVFARTVNEYFFSFVPLIIAEIFLTWLPSIPSKKN